MGCVVGWPFPGLEQGYRLRALWDWACDTDGQVRRWAGVQETEKVVLLLSPSGLYSCFWNNFQGQLEVEFHFIFVEVDFYVQASGI